MNKRILLASILTLSFLMPAVAQVYFSEDFNDVAVQGKAGDIPAGWTLYNDGNRPSPTFAYCDQAWKVIEITGGNKKAISTSWFTNPNARADRWMVTPPINLPDTALPYLMFDAQSGDVSDRESYSIKVSVAGVEKEHFTETLLTVTEENYNEQQRAINLEQFKDKTIYIAFILNSLNKYALYLDNIVVEDLSKPTVTLSKLNAPIITTIDSEINVTATGFLKSHEPVSSYTINYSINGGATVTHTADGLSINNLESFVVSAPTFSFEKDGVYAFELWLSGFNGAKNTYSDTLRQNIEVTGNTYYPRKSLLEVFSSSTCGPCASANRYIRKAYKALNANTEESNLYVMKYQVNIPNTGDPAVTDESLYKASYYNVKSAPSGFLNGKKYVGQWENIEEELPQKVENELNNKTPFLLEASMQRTYNHYKVDVTITNTGAYAGTLLYVAFVEDSIYHEPQSNGETEFFYVFRKALPSPYGETLSFSESGRQTLSYEYTFDMERPKIFHSLDGVSAIVFLHDSESKEVLQTTYIAPVTSDVGVSSSPTAEIQRHIAPNPCKEHCRLHLSLRQDNRLEIEVYDLRGQRVRQIVPQHYLQGAHTIDLPLNNLPAGMYFVRVSGKDVFFTEKILLL